MQSLKKQHTTGFVKLPSNYLQTVKRAEQFAGVTINSFTLMKVLAHALPNLSDQQHRLLQFYLADMNLNDISNGESSVWKSSDFTQKSLGWSRSKVARIKAELRDLGMITVHYDMRNRPLEGQAVTLAPFFADMNRHEEAIQQAFEARRRKYKQEQVEQQHIKNECQGLKDESLIQTPQFYRKDTVPKGVSNDSSFNEACGHEDRDRTATQQSTTHQALQNKPSHWSSRKNQRNSVPPVADNRSIPDLTDATREKISAAIDLAPQLKKLIDCDISSLTLTGDQLYSRCHRAVRNIWPECNTADHTFRWAMKRFGWRAIEILVVALEDPNILKPQQWFGAMATKQSEQFALEPNFKRIRMKGWEKEVESAETMVRSDLIGLVRFLGQETVVNWYGKVDLVKAGGVLSLICPNEFYRHHISTRHCDGLLKWAATMQDAPAEGWKVVVQLIEPSKKGA